MEQKIKDAITLLKENGYFVTKMPEKLNNTAKTCCETDCGDCMECNCFVCMLGNE